MFAQMMMPHHSQALHMAELAPTRSSSPAVKTLAATIEAAQQPELDKMNGWIKSWGGSLNTSHSSMSDGMMTDSDMSDLTEMSGTDFDHAFLTMMIQHHEGAIAMAENELEQGVNADALALAASIQMTQHAQVTQMQSLLE